jgi:hypothetical protein
VTASSLKRWQRVVLWRPLRFVLPTATTLYFNHHHLRAELKTAALPDEVWAHREASGLLSRSEDRLRSLEAKGPGLATVAAVVAAGVVAAIIEGGGDATLVGKILLGISVWYAIWSLSIPIYLVGPQARETIDLNHVVAAAQKDSPEQYLAERAQKAAQRNVRRGQRIGNLQDGARNELGAALAVLVLWLLLGPATGVLERDSARAKPQPQPPGRTTAAREASATTTHPTTPTRPSAEPASRTTSKRGSQGRLQAAPKAGGTQAPDPAG